MRVDAGFENIAPCRFLQHFGSIIEPVRSIDNQRVERYWVDVKLRGLSFYINVINRLKKEYKFSTVQSFHVWIVQYIIIDR